MPKPYYKKEIVYYVENIEKAQKLRDDLYDTYESVSIYHNGLSDCKVICELLI